MEDLNFDVVEEQLRDDSGDIILQYRRLEWDDNVLPSNEEPAYIWAYDVEFPMECVGIYAYERYLKKNIEDITQQDLDTIDVDKFYDFLCDYYEEDAMWYAYDNDLYEYDYDYYGSNDNGGD